MNRKQTTDYFQDFANNLMVSFNYDFIGASDEVAVKLEPSEVDFETMIDLVAKGYHSGEIEFIAEDETSYRLIWEVKDQDVIDEDDEEEYCEDEDY